MHSTRLSITQLVEDSALFGACVDSLRRKAVYIADNIHIPLNTGLSKHTDASSVAQIDVINGLQLLTAKNVIYLVNLSEKDYVRKKNKWLVKIKAWVDENNPGDLIIPFSVAFEERLAMMSPEEQKAETEKLGATSALGKIMIAGYQGLHVRAISLRTSRELICRIVKLIRYFTAGPEESRAWTIREGTLAPAAAGVIHGDFEKVRHHSV